MGLQHRPRRRQNFILGVFCTVIAFSAMSLFLHVGRTSSIFGGLESDLKRVSGRGYTNFIDKRAQFNASVRMSSDIDVFHEPIEGFMAPKFTTSNKFPCGNHTEVLVYFNSKWDNFMKRRRLRSTWASTKIFRQQNVHFLFLVGKPDDVNDHVRLQNEQILHGDVVIGDFVDSYYNLTLKSLVAINFIEEHCTSLKYVIKADDDIFVNLFKVMKEILPVMHPDQNEIACHVIESGKSPIMRDKASRWYIPSNIFPNQTYLPQFCSGYMVILTSTLMSNLYTKSKVTPLIHVDDVYMFGRLTQDIVPLKFIDIKQNLTLWQDKGVDKYRKGRSDYFAVNVRDIEAMEEMWSLILMKSSQKQKKVR